MKKDHFSREEKIERIRRYVKKQRERKKIGREELSPHPIPEPSCFGYGEAYNFVECQLVYTTHQPNWDLLKEDSILEMAFNYVKFGKRFV